MKRKIALGVGVAIVLVIGAIAAFVFSVFGSNKPVEDGAVYASATVIEDAPYVAMFLLDAGEGKFVLVDAGADAGGDALRAALSAKGATAENIEAVLLTHGHADHIGAAYGLTGVPIWAHEADVALVEGKVAPNNSIGALAGPNPAGLKVAKTFKGGDKLTFGRLSIEVFHTPGHTPGNSTFVVDGVVLMGDTAQVSKDDTLRAPPAVFTEDPAEAIASIRALGASLSEREEKPTILVGAHSGATRNVEALLNYQGE